MSVFELTQYQWKLFNSTKGFHFKGSDMLPAESFSWTNIRGRRTDGYNWPDNGHNVSGDSILGKMRNVTGLEFDLPTEAQWEYACRAGSSAAFANDRSDIGNLGWYNITNATVEAARVMTAGSVPFKSYDTSIEFGKDNSTLTLSTTADALTAAAKSTLQKKTVFFMLHLHFTELSPEPTNGFHDACHNPYP